LAPVHRGNREENEGVMGAAKLTGPVSNDDGRVKFKVVKQKAPDVQKR